MKSLQFILSCITNLHEGLGNVWKNLNENEWNDQIGINNRLTMVGKGSKYNPVKNNLDLNAIPFQKLNKQIEKHMEGKKKRKLNEPFLF